MARRLAGPRELGQLRGDRPREVEPPPWTKVTLRSVAELDITH